LLLDVTVRGTEGEEGGRERRPILESDVLLLFSKHELSVLRIV
jgi:hypothetical protein